MKGKPPSENKGQKTQNLGDDADNIFDQKQKHTNQQTAEGRLPYVPATDVPTMYRVDEKKEGYSKRKYEGTSR